MSFDPLTPFDEITSSVPMVSPFEAMWNAAEERLHAERPEGFQVEEIGRIAFNSLPESERAEALDVLFYTYWAATIADRDTRAMHDGGAL
jgi:phage terminase large subunit GpA-like protein